jgi:hypothetical protein
MCMLCNGSDHCLLIRRDDSDTIGPGVCFPGLTPPILVEHFVPPKCVFITVVTRHDGELHHGGPTTAARIHCRNAVDDHDAIHLVVVVVDGVVGGVHVVFCERCFVSDFL